MSATTRPIPSYQPALAILLPRRGYATDTTPHGGDSGPPPGFDINEAKKPLPKEESKKSAQTPSISELKKDEDMNMSRSEPSAVDKTSARKEATLTEVAAEKAAATTKAEEKQVEAKQEERKKLTIGQKIKKEIQHYWDGTKLLATEVRISSRLALKMAAGYELSRRENRQVLLSHFRTQTRANLVIAAKDSPGSGSSCTVFRLRHCPICRTTSPSRAEAVPQSPSIDLRGTEVEGRESHTPPKDSQSRLRVSAQHST